MGRLRAITIRNYRSIRETVRIALPQGAPLVLIGENNAGKSNIVLALDLLLGEAWPGNHDPDDHEFHGRDRDNGPIEISAELGGVDHISNYGAKRVASLTWRFPPAEGRSLTMSFQGGGTSPYVSNDTRGQCCCILIGADRRLSYQLSYASKFTLLSKLMKMFHQSLMSDADRVKQLQSKFDELKVLFNGVQEFEEFTETLQEQLDDFSGNLTYGLGIDFSAYDPSGYFRALRVQPNEAGAVRSFDELGTGQEQILALSFAYAYAKAFHRVGGLVLIIEEPEAHLHPLAQEWVSRKVHELSETGLQIVITTHSPAFLNLLNLEGLVLVRKERGVTRTVQLSKEKLAHYCKANGAPQTTPETVLPFYAAAATEDLLAGFFARAVVLVEGPTESLALPVYLRQVGLNTLRDGIAVLPVRGVGNLAKWWRLFTAYGIPTYVAFDNDRTDDGNGTKRADVLRTLGVAEDRFTELCSTQDWVIEDTFCVFGTDFESTMRRHFGQAYIELEKEAADQFGLRSGASKPLVARYVAERLTLSGSDEGMACLLALAGRIRALARVPEHSEQQASLLYERVLRIENAPIGERSTRDG